MQVADLVVVAGGAERAKVPLCIEQAGAVGALVCDGRLVVDAAFRTNDPNIFAAGTVATFSRRSPCLSAVYKKHQKAFYLVPCMSCGLRSAAAVASCIQATCPLIQYTLMTHHVKHAAALCCYLACNSAMLLR